MTTLEYATARASSWWSVLVPLLLSLLAFPFVAAGWTGGVAVLLYRAALLAVRTGYSEVVEGRPRAD